MSYIISSCCTLVTFFQLHVGRSHAPNALFLVDGLNRLGGLAPFKDATSVKTCGGPHKGGCVGLSIVGSLWEEHMRKLILDAASHRRPVTRYMAPSGRTT